MERTVTRAKVRAQRRYRMLVGITGTEGSGRKTVLAILLDMGYELVEDTPESFSKILPRWREKFVVLIRESTEEISQRPWFVHLNLAASEQVRRGRMKGSLHDVSKEILKTDINNVRAAHINLVNNHATVAELRAEILALDLTDSNRVRPSWDEYFMIIANLAAQRSNCMKRKVGCVLVKDRKIVSTGYNGTPRGSLNCNEGGCQRCNSGSSKGTLLSTCFCLHAEENALLEAGRDRVQGSVLYCNTCPCVTCSIKILQCGVSEVVYSRDYSMDDETSRLLKSGGVAVRKYVV